jgi:selenocysteine lyase/cysteine desulfurase
MSYPSPNSSLDIKTFSGVTSSTRLIVMTHASNVTGTILPVTEIASIAHQSGALVLIDAAQTAGVVPVYMQADGIDLLAFTGLKELQGPPGTGGLVISESVDASQIEPLMRGARRRSNRRTAR